MESLLERLQKETPSQTRERSLESIRVFFNKSKKLKVTLVKDL